MAKAIKHRRGTTEEHSTFVGLEGEITVDTTKKTLVVHDQETVGGFPLARESAVTNLDTRVETLENKAIQAETAIESKINREEAEQTFVHKSEDETITGEKTFTSKISFKTNNGTVSSGIAEVDRVINEELLIAADAPNAQTGPLIALRQPNTADGKHFPLIIKSGHETNNIGHQMSIRFNTGKAAVGGDDFGHLEFHSLKNNGGFYIPLEFLDFVPNGTWGHITPTLSKTFETFDGGRYVQTKFADGWATLYGSIFIPANSLSREVPLHLPAKQDSTGAMFVTTSGWNAVGDITITFNKFTDRVVFYRRSIHNVYNFDMEVNYNIHYVWR